MHRLLKGFPPAILAMLIAGCASQPTVMSSNPMSGTGKKPTDTIETMALTTVDFEYAAHQIVSDWLRNPAADKPGGGKWVVSFDPVTNDTPILFDTRSVTSRMKKAMTDSGRFIFTAAAGQERSSSVRDARDLQNSPEFDKSTVAAAGTVVAPELAMSGRIGLRNVISGDSKSQQNEYEFDFRVFNLANGLELFNMIQPIDKLGANKNFAW
jgi:uncharacterized protein (TIGR02722 family)